MSPFLAGLCTVTCRSLSIDRVVELAAASGVEALEWGGDVHVPPGDLGAAERAAVSSAEAGLAVVSYGSYLILDANVADHLGSVLETASALGAPGVRVWAPFGIEPGCADQDRRMVTDAASLAASAATDHGLHLTLEFHGGTLTATAASTRQLLDDVDDPSLFTAWQPPYWAPRSEPEEQEDLRLLAPALSHVHVYEWDPDLTRHPLARRADRWTGRLRSAAGSGASAVDAAVPRTAMIEFVPDDDPGRLPIEVATLHSCLAGVNG